jgi:branched-chain amino acid transport system permease protein
LIFVLAAVGNSAAGALWLASLISFQPKTYFNVQWTAYIIFMALLGGLGTFEGPIVGAITFFIVETLFGGQGVWYLVGLGASALLFALFVPRGLWETSRLASACSLCPWAIAYAFPPKRNPTQTH